MKDFKRKAVIAHELKKDSLREWRKNSCSSRVWRCLPEKYKIEDKALKTEHIETLEQGGANQE